MFCELVDSTTLNLGTRAECFQGEGALSGNLQRHLIVRRCSNIEMVLKCRLNSNGNAFESLKEWKVTGPLIMRRGGGGGDQYYEKKKRSWPFILDISYFMNGSNYICQMFGVAFPLHELIFHCTI